MSHPPTEQGWSGRGDDTVAVTQEGSASGAAEHPRARPADDAGPVTATGCATGYATDAAAHARPAPSGWPVPTNTKAIIALCTVFYVPVLGIVFGVMARREIDRTGEGGRAYATWGLALGIAFCTLIALYVLAYVVFFAVLFSNLGNAFTAGGGPGLGA